MRCREPFQGYKLSSGHPLFHLAYIIGAYFATFHVLGYDAAKAHDSYPVLKQLILAHILVPLFNLLSFVCDRYGWNVMEKSFDIISIFQYQATIFIAQHYQMNSAPEKKMDGINTWFIIEILSFYGYILSAVIFVVQSTVRSTLGWRVKHPDSSKFDFIAFHRKDLDWAAFVQILFNVNLGLIMIDKYIVFDAEELTDLEYHQQFPLTALQYQLLVNHAMQMIFLREFYVVYHDAETNSYHQKLNVKSIWVWYFHFVSYSYIIFVYFFTDAAESDRSHASRMWVPLDILLTASIFAYFMFYYVVESGDHGGRLCAADESHSSDAPKLPTDAGDQAATAHAQEGIDAKEYKAASVKGESNHNLSQAPPMEDQSS